MAQMNKIKFLSGVEVPSINTETMVVSGNLTVKGETIAEDAIHSVIEGAVTVVNGGAVESQTTLMGQVILTGYRAYTMYFDSLTFNDLLNEPISISGGDMRFYIEEVEYSGLYFEDGATLKSYLDGSTLITLYENGSWVDDSYKTITNVEAWLPIEAKNWLLNNARTYDLTSEGISANEAYGILYDPSTEAIRLGAGYYQGNTGTFQFSEGEGEPIAVRDLSAEDDGSLIMWDAENYRLVKAPIVTDDNGVHVDGNVTISGNITTSNGTLKIGNTTITESQLQQLLTLLNSGENDMIINESELEEVLS